jgi:hypothetical protein
MTKAAAIMEKIEKIANNRRILNKAILSILRNSKGAEPAERISRLAKVIKNQTGELRPELIAQIRKQQKPFKASTVDMWPYYVTNHVTPLPTSGKRVGIERWSAELVE